MNAKCYFIVCLFSVFALLSNAQSNCANISASFTTPSANFCGVGPHLVNFTNTSTGLNANPAGYQWYLNGVLYASTTGFTAPPTSTISAIGVYNYMMVGFDTLGVCRDTAFQQINIVQKPTANFIFNTSVNYCPNDSIPFTNTSTNTLAGTKYYWNFDGRSGDSSFNSSTIFGSGGTKNVSLIVFNSLGCSDTITKTINLLNTPNINIFGDDGTGDLINCLGAFDTTTSELVTFINFSDSLITYTWDFGDGTPPVAQTYGSTPDTLTHRFNSYGTFPVICSATAPNGCIYTDTLFVVFDKFISASFTIPPLQISGCTPHLVQPTNVSPPYNTSTYTWDFGDGTPPVVTTSYAAPSHIYDSTGVYTITLTATNDCSSAVSTFSFIRVSTTPEVDFGFSLFGRGCSPQSITFTNLSTLVSPVTNYTWIMDNGNIYNGVPPPAQTYLQGTYSVKLRASNGCGTDSLTRSFTIDTLPHALVTVSATEGCSPMTVNASAIEFGYGTLSRWFVDGNQVAFGDTMPTQTFTNTGTTIQTHTIRYLIENHCGQYDTTITITVHPSVQVILDPTLLVVCVGSSLTHRSLSTGDSLMYSWFFGDGTTSTIAGPHTKTYNRKGIDSVKLVISGYCGVDSITKLITVDSLPYANAYISPQDGCSPLSVSGNAITFGNGTTSSWFKSSTFNSNGDSLYATVFNNFGNTLVNDSIRFSLSNLCGTYDTVFPITIHPDVVARVNPSVSSVCFGDTVVFNNTSLGDSLTFLWRFGNGDTSTIAGPQSRVFNSIGNDTTWLIVSGYCGVDSVRAIITSNKHPIANIVADTLNGCEDLRVNFTNGAGLGSTYSWTFSGGFPVFSSSYTPSVLFTTPGTNRVVLRVDSVGCPAFDTVLIDVFPGPDPSFTVSPLSGCSDLIVGINNMSPIALGDKYNWMFGNRNTDTVYNPSNQVFVNSSNTNDSIYGLKLIINTANGCSDSTTQSVTVRPIPSSSFTNNDTVVCEKELISFINTSVGAFSNKWYFGDGDSSFVGNPSHSYDTLGTYTVLLITSSIWNCKDTSTQTIVVNPNPIVDFVFDTVCYTYSTSFIDSSKNSANQWFWSFGDGDTSTLQNPIHTYKKDSTYPVKLNVVNSFGCADSITLPVLVYVQPVGGFGWSAACPQRVTNFYDSSLGNPIKWSWNFGDGSVDSIQNPSHTYSFGGTYIVTLIVQNASGCVDTISKSVLISTIPKTIFFADSVCVGFPTTFIDSTKVNYPILSHFWTFGDGRVSSLVNPSHQYLSAGTYAVSLTVTNINGCDSTYVDSVIVRPSPVPQFTAVPISGCSPLSVSFNNTSPVSVGDTYGWSFGDGNSDTVYSPTTNTYLNISNTQDTIYTIQLTITTAYGCIDSLKNQVTVHPLPLSTFSPSDTVVCEKETIFFNNNSVGATNHRWYFGDGDSSYFTSPSHSFDTAGTYIVTLISTSFWNCTDTSYDTIVVNYNPVVRFTSDSACLTFNTTFSDSTLYNPITWKWYFGDGDSSSLQNPIHLYAKDTQYTVTLNVSNIYGCVASAQNIAVVHTQPVAGFTISTACAKKITSFTDTSSGNPNKWFWDFGDGSIDSIQNPTHVYALGGTYTVMLIVENRFGCFDTIIKPIVISTVPSTYFIADSVCHGKPTTFTNFTTDTYPIVSYFWDFGDGNSSSLQNPVYQYLNPGTYLVSLTATNTNGCDSIYVDSVVVYPSPSANFTHDTVCSGFGTHFISSSSLGSPIYYIWNYGDGSPLDTNNSTSFYYTYASDGAYSVKLKVINADGCEDSVSQTVIVHPTPVAQFFPQVDSICLGDGVTFLNSSLLGTRFYWDFGDGNLDSSINPTHTYSLPGLYQVRLTVENSFGCISNIDDTVTVLPNPTANFNLDTVCLGNFTSFTDLSSGTNLSWNWSFGDGNSSSQQNPSHVYGIDSSFTVLLTVSTPFGCFDTASKTSVVLPIVDANLGYSLACISRPINFIDSSVGNVTSWSWDFGDGSTSAIQNPMHTYSITGNYTVSLVVTNAAGCSDTILKNIFVNTIPVPNFTADSVCFGNRTSFTNLTTNTQPIATYFWDYGDGNSSFGINPTYTFGAPGTYNVTLTVTNNGGCDSSITIPVLVRLVPVADFTHDTVCLGLPTTFADISSGTPNFWKWNFGDFSPIDSLSGSSATHSYSAAGVYVASLTVRDGTSNCESTVFKYITVRGDVNASFNVATPICDGTTVLFVNTSTATTGTIVSTSWRFGDGNTSFLTNPTHLYAGPGVYRVSLDVVSSFGCVSSDSILVVVNAKPTANFGYINNICLGNPTPFTDSSLITVGTITRWNWNFGDGNTNTVQNPGNTYAAPGTYLVTLQVISDSGCTDNIVKSITINPESIVNFSYIPVCVGDTMKFKDLTTINPPDSIVSWFWDFGDGNTSTLKNPSHVYVGNTQTYLVRLTVTSKFGCINDTLIPVSHLPVPVFNYGPQLFAYCEKDPVQFYDSSTIAPPSSIVGWEWYFRDGYNSFIQNPVHTYDSAGSYKVKIRITTSDGCVFYDSLPAPIIIYPNPIANFDPIPNSVSVFRPEVYFNNTSSGATNWSWSFGDGTTGFGFDPTHLYPNVVGTFSATQYAYSDFGCVDSITKNIIIKDEFTLYVPNSFTPEKETNNEFRVYGYQIKNYSIKIFNRWGELIFESNDPSEAWDGTYNGTKCEMDVYVYQIISRDLKGNDYEKTGHINLIR